MENRVKLEVLGITQSQIQVGAYALLLAESGGDYRIPVVIGASEAQSIAAKLEGVTLPRPLVHDMFYSMTRAFGIRLKNVFIYRFEKGVFYSELTFVDRDDREVTIDSRTSDAVALAIRTNSPLYTTEEILKTTGFVVQGGSERVSSKTEAEEPEEVPLNRFAVKELEKMMQRCIEREEYERAAEIKKVIKEKNEKSNV